MTRDPETLVPVSVLTGFLGSGKTTILTRLVRDEAFSDTAVILNEFGEVGLDHLLVEAADETIIDLSCGCICCTIRGDLMSTLVDLHARREAGSIRSFRRVIIETTGLADPAPIIHTLMQEPDIFDIYRLAAVTTVVDTVNGLLALGSYGEPVRQVAVADVLLLTKTDIARADQALIRKRLDAINPVARQETCLFGNVEPSLLFGDGLSIGPRQLRGIVSETVSLPDGHADDIDTFVIHRDRPLNRGVLMGFLQMLADQKGDSLLRVKGLAALQDDPARPAVVHGVQHVVHQFRRLSGWPTGMPVGLTLVFIVRGLTQDWVEDLLDQMETSPYAMVVR